ncbi:hypothetical protein S83_051584, partial [Arachis hypogaea]
NEINILKKEIHLIKQQQQQHQNCLSHILHENSDNTKEKPQNDQNLQNQISQNEEEDQILQLSKDDPEDEIAEILWLVSQLTVMKFYINIRIVIQDFVLDTVALFDTGADKNCILEGLIPTKYFEKMGERLNTATSERLQIKYRLLEVVIKNGLLRINTPFLLVQDLRNQVILRTPFIRAIFPLMMSYE